MYSKIIIASALDQGFSARAIRTAKALLSENGKIIAVHVIEPINEVVDSFVTEEAKSKARGTIKDMMADRLQDEQDIEAVILAGHPGSEIPAYAEKVQADCIIVGSHKPGLQDFFLGSTSSRVVRHAKCAVHVLR
ncbi:MAG: universal stress protein [Rhizobiaceae bacterium]